MPQPAAGSFFHTPGPKEVFVQFRGSGAWQFLGTCVSSVQEDETPQYLPVFSDYSGRSVPAQLVYDGTEAHLSCVLNRVDLAVARNLRDAATRFGLASTVGKDGNLSRGSLVLGSKDFRLAFKNLYFGTVNATPGMVPGRMYYSAVVGGYKEDSIGTRVEEVGFLFSCYSLMDNSKSFSLFTEDSGEGEFGSMNSN